MSAETSPPVITRGISAGERKKIALAGIRFLIAFGMLVMLALLFLGVLSTGIAAIWTAGQ